MIALAGAALHARDAAIGIQRDNDVFTNLFAFPTSRFDIASELRAINYTKRIVEHYFYSISICFDFSLSNEQLLLRHGIADVHAGVIRFAPGHRNDQIHHSISGQV